MLQISAYLVLMTCLNLPYIYAANAKRSPMPASDAIQYPGPAKDMDPDAGIPKECRGKNYCTVKPPDYPQEKFDKMFKDYKLPLKNLQPSLVTGPTLDNRQGDPDEMDNCLSVVTYEPLYKVKDKKSGDFRTVIQAPDHDYVQKVRLETCTNPGGKCFDKVFAQNSDYETFCKQKENTWEVVVDGKDGPETIKTELPVCCSCHYRPVNLASRFGGKEINTSPAKKN